MEMGLAYLAYAVLGVIAGILSGLLGIGGGVITVPCLFYIYHLLGYPQPYLMQMAVATSLAAMILTTAAATWAHNRRKGVLWSILKKMVLGLVIGSVVGALIAIWISGVVLEIFFGLFLCALAIRFYLQKNNKSSTHRLPGTPVLTLLSGCIGALSNLLGIGGGSLTVPMLVYFKIPDKNAIGTSSATTLITSILGSISYMIFAWDESIGMDTIGLINIPSFLIVGVATFFLAPYGARLTHEISPQKVRKIFAIVLALTGISLII
jgi:uncharacterized membrane protein YfcA